ncbi:hypothetical protein ASZ90_015625 [hydrocarbon metagenome]|uniref:Uncharacterized protein n=1 Tax=hydrocarbon metagenome TaxID=938273 RepID=A0A0W8F1F8_9ZZZZ
MRGEGSPLAIIFSPAKCAGTPCRLFFPLSRFPRYVFL